MIFNAEKTLYKFVRDFERKILWSSIIGVLLMVLIGFGIYTESEGGFSKDKLFFLAGVVLIIIFFLFTYTRSAFIFSRTIREITINDSNVCIKTYTFKIFWLFAAKGKTKEMPFDKFVLRAGQFPLQLDKKSGAIDCYFLETGEEEYYFLNKDFKESVLISLSDRLKLK
jgi:hypothetical protein